MRRLFGLWWSLPQQPLHAGTAQDFGGACGHAVEPPFELLDGEAVGRRGLADLDLQLGAWPEAIDPPVPLQPR